MHFRLTVPILPKLWYYLFKAGLYKKKQKNISYEELFSD